MTLWTWAEIEAKVKNDLDLNEETMITPEELMAYGNEAIDEAEQHVLGVDESYFLQSTALELVDGSSLYDLPSNIYAMKLRRILYDNGSDAYEIKRIRDISTTQAVEDDDDYRYMLIMNSSGVHKLKLYPASRENSESNVTIWHVGNANAMTTSSSVMNIPEAVHFVIAKIKHSCLRKEGHPGQVEMKEEVDRQRQLLIETLAAMVLDENNQILIDQNAIVEYGYDFEV